MTEVNGPDGGLTINEPDVERGSGDGAADHGSRPSYAEPASGFSAVTLPLAPFANEEDVP